MKQGLVIAMVIFLACQATPEADAPSEAAPGLAIEDMLVETSSLDSICLRLRIEGTDLRESWPVLFQYKAESLGTWMLLDTADTTFTIWLKPETRVRFFMDHREDVMREAIEQCKRQRR